MTQRHTRQARQAEAVHELVQKSYPQAPQPPPSIFSPGESLQFGAPLRFELTELHEVKRKEGRTLFAGRGRALPQRSSAPMRNASERYLEIELLDKQLEAAPACFETAKSQSLPKGHNLRIDANGRERELVMKGKMLTYMHILKLNSC